MKLVLIEGTYLARYEGRKQLEIVRVENWEGDYDMRSFVEAFRTAGIPDDVQVQQR